MWVRFIEDFRWKPSRQVSQVYRAWTIHNVPTRCALEAVAKGKAVKMKKPSRQSTPTEEQADHVSDA